MPQLMRSGVASQTGAGTVTIADVPTGIQWIVYQTSVETLPAGFGVSAYIKQNGRLVTSSPNGSSDSAQGPPFIRLSAGDLYTIEWVGAPAASALIVTLYYKEVPYGQIALDQSV